MGENFDRGKSKGYRRIATCGAAVKYGAEKRSHRHNFTQLLYARNFKVAYAKLLRNSGTAGSIAEHTCAFIAGAAILIGVVAVAALIIVVVRTARIMAISKRQLHSMATVRTNKHVNMRANRSANNQQAEGNSGNMFCNTKHNDYKDSNFFG